MQPPLSQGAAKAASVRSREAAAAGRATAELRCLSEVRRRALLQLQSPDAASNGFLTP